MRLRTWLEQRFFRTVPPLDLAILRLLVVGLQLFVMLVPYALFSYPVWGRLHLLAALPDAQFEAIPVLRLLLLPFGDGVRPPLAVMVAILWVTIAAGFLALVGWRTHAACFLFALGNLLVTAYAYSYGEHHHVEALTIVTLFALAIGPSGAACSIDAWLLRRRSGNAESDAHGGGNRSSTANGDSNNDVDATGRNATAESTLAAWPLELVRWLFSITYLSAALCKVLGSGLEWMNGYTLQTYLLQEGVFWGTSSSRWLADHHGLCVELSWFTVLVEGLFFLVLPWPRLAWLLVPSAAAMHVGIQITMRAPFALYLPLYAAFVPWSHVGAWVATRKRGAQK